MSRRRIGWNLAATAYDKLLIAIIQLAMVPLLAQHWGVHLYGCWLMLNAVPGFLALADLGIGGATFARMVALVARGEHDEAVVAMHSARQVLAVACGAMLVLGGLAIWALPASWLPSDPALNAGQARAVLVLLLLYTLAILQGALRAAGFASIQRFALYVLVNAHVLLLEAGLIVAAVLSGHGPVVAAAAMLAARVTGLAVLDLTLRRRAAWLRPGMACASAIERRVLARSAASMLAVPLGQAVTLQGTVMVLGAAVGSAATPAFVAARTLSRIGAQATLLLTHALLPEFARVHAQGDARGKAAMLLAVIATSCAVALPFALVMGFGGEWLLRLWTGGALVAPPGLMPVVAISVVLGGLWVPLSSLMVAIDRQGVFAWTYLLLGAASLGLTYVLAASLNATGAAIAFAALDACMVAIIGRFAWRYWLTGLPMAAAVRSAARSAAQTAARWRRHDDSGAIGPMDDDAVAQSRERR